MTSTVAAQQQWAVKQEGRNAGGHEYNGMKVKKQRKRTKILDCYRFVMGWGCAQCSQARNEGFRGPSKPGDDPTTYIYLLKNECEMWTDF